MKRIPLPIDLFHLFMSTPLIFRIEVDSDESIIWKWDLQI